MREHYLDNLRIAVILLLIPYHTFMIWNNFGSQYYIWGGDNNVISSLLLFVSPWFMPVLFVVAGISARYSLEKRSAGSFIIERVKKLLIPLIFGLILLVPIQGMYARKFFFEYKGNVIDNFIYFYTHASDLNGYDGMFTFGHLWFLLFLFVIALVSLILVKKIPFRKVKKVGDKINIVIILCLFILLFGTHYLGNIGGKSIGEYLLLYLFGYYLFTDKFIEKLLKFKTEILSLFSIVLIIFVMLYFKYGIYNDLFVSFVEWLGILSCIVMSKLFLNKENKITKYFRKASFPIYILHQTILVIIGYYSLKYINNLSLQILTIIFGSFLVTLTFYEVISKIPYVRKVIGLR